MHKPVRYYIVGLFIAFCYLIAAELVWLPGPLTTRSGLQWIEMIDYLFYGLSLVPLSWAAGALLGIGRLREKERALKYALLPVRCMIALLGLSGAYAVLLETGRLVWILTTIAAAAVLVFMDMLLSESAAGGGAAANDQGGSKIRLRLRLPVKGGSVLLLTVALLAFFLYPTGYRVTYPGMTLNMNRYAHAEGGGSGGEVNGVLVFERPAAAADWLLGMWLPWYEFEKIQEGEPPLSESYTQVVAMKNDANGIAASVAMNKAGVGGGVTADGVRIVAIVKDSPAEQRLQAGDVIVKLNGQAVKSVEELAAYMERSVKPGDTVAVTVRRGEEVEVAEVPAAASAESPGRPVFGISVQDELHLDIPRAMDYKRLMAHIGGPSHGAMLTLAIIDQLTPGGVTYGLKVAGTGTIEADGSIGLIGGIRQKAYAVNRTGADVFFVPAALEQEARKAAPKLNVVPVETIDDVLKWLAQRKS
ncbi:PDZ domain-containing protein [Paenibacillus sp. N4]|uniref:PDZ domain-containing protein n=1 Tax=Paenibacillus vietnamensis TaxID=2590547 RepID=UPI001CD0A2AD|nr:PDZ domain-containing protein [Paenibacillus vietnamensis]MCA0754683.1 PDZ domain-containing protein [Paenibacillus vietnamensis]